MRHTMAFGGWKKKKDTKEGGEGDLGGAGRKGDYDPNLGHAILKGLRKVL